QDFVACVRFSRQIGGKQIRPAGGASTHQNTGNNARNHARFCARPPMLRQAWYYVRFARIHCENSHFSPELGGRPACSVRRSGEKSGNIFQKNSASPLWPRKRCCRYGNSVSPPA